MGVFRKCIAVLLVLGVLGGLAPEQARAHRMTERVYDPATGETFLRDVPHRHRYDGSIVMLDGTSYYDGYTYTSPYASYYSTPYYSSSYYRPYGYYSDSGYRRSSGVGPAILGAGIGYAIGRSSRR